MERNVYCCLVSEAKKLVNTFTISYNVIGYKDEFYSSTYDELSGWLRKALKIIEENEEQGRESELYRYLRKFRGKSGDITLKEMEHIISELGS